MTKVLLIEDDSETAEEITAELADRGFEVEWSANGIEGLDKARSLRPDAMIVDRLLPGMDGLTVIEALRKDQVRTPVLVLSALGAVDDRVRGLRMGGDDYLTKPFAVVELIARIEALLRRPAELRETTLRAGSLELDLIERTAKRGDRVIDLLPREFRLLEYMMQRSDQLLTRAMLAGGSLELQVRSGDQSCRRAHGPPAPQGGRSRRSPYDPQCPWLRFHSSRRTIGFGCPVPICRR